MMFESIMAVNGYAMRTIQDVEKNAPSPYSLAALISFYTEPTTQEVIVGAFTSAMNTFSAVIERLILEAEVSMQHLDTLEEDLSAVREAVTREDVSVSELLGALWTQFGMNKRTLRDYERRLNLLKDLGNYRKQAQAHVLAALQTLNSMSEDMEDLRERVAAPELVDDRIPLHVHIESIQDGLRRLQEGRVRAKEREEEVMRRILGRGAD
jgi:DNA repair ATPase RecN